MRSPRPFTPRDWLPVAAAITEDANRRVAGGISETAREAAAIEWRREHHAAAASGDTAGTHEAARKLRAAQIAAGAAAATLQDLVAHVGPGSTAGAGAPAFYREHDRTIAIDSAVALPGVDPASVRWDDPLWRAEHLRAAGLVEHEVGHAAHTPRRVLAEWAAAGGEVNDFARRLEETRMEAATIAAGGDRAALAGVAHELILRDFSGVSGDPYRDALDAALILGRSETVGGSLTEEDVKPFKDAYAARHGGDWVTHLEDLLSVWNSTEDRDVPDGAGMRSLCDHWRSVLGEGAADDPGEAGGDGAPDPSGASESPSGGSGESGEGEGSEGGGGSAGGDTEPGDDSDSDAADDDSDDDDSGDTSGGGDDTDGDDTDGGGGSGEGGDDDDSDTEPDSDTEADGSGDPIRDMIEKAAGEAGRKAAAAAREMRDAQEAEDRRETERVTHGYSPGHGRFHKTGTLTPTPEHRRFAVDLSRKLRSLALPEVAKSKRPAVLPPGRLRGRGAVARAAQIAGGQVPSAEPFTRTQKSVTRTPPPVVGIMLDVSGSMGGAKLPAAVTAWALHEAGRSVQARTALTTFGDRGRLVDHSPTQITVTECGGSWENFREGFALLDRKLKLTTPAQGARVLVVISDGALVGPGEGEAAARIMRRLESQGVVCIWAAIGCSWEGHYGDGWTNRAGHVVKVDRAAIAAGGVAAAAAPIVEGIAAAMRRVRVSV